MILSLLPGELQVQSNLRMVLAPGCACNGGLSARIQLLMERKCALWVYEVPRSLFSWDGAEKIG